MYLLKYARIGGLAAGARRSLRLVVTGGHAWTIVAAIADLAIARRCSLELGDVEMAGYWNYQVGQVSVTGVALSRSMTASMSP